MKPFTDGEFIKKCLLAVAEEVKNPEDFNKITLSRRTVTRRVEILSRDICDTLKNKSKQFEYFSLGFDETNDITDTAQLVIFIRGVDKDMNITEEFLDLMSLHGRATGEKIKEAVLTCIRNHDLDISKLISIATDGAPAMVGKILVL